MALTPKQLPDNSAPEANCESRYTPHYQQGSALISNPISLNRATPVRSLGADETSSNNPLVLMAGISLLGFSHFSCLLRLMPSSDLIPVESCTELSCYIPSKVMQPIDR